MYVWIFSIHMCIWVFWVRKCIHTLSILSFASLLCYFNKNCESWVTCFEFVNKHIQFYHWTAWFPCIWGNLETITYFDCFAIAGIAKLPETLAPSIVKVIPRRLTCFIWYAIMNARRIRAMVLSAKAKSSPVVQDGLEIPVSIKVEWMNELSLYFWTINIYIIYNITL